MCTLIIPANGRAKSITYLATSRPFCRRAEPVHALYSKSECALLMKGMQDKLDPIKNTLNSDNDAGFLSGVSNCTIERHTCPDKDPDVC